MALSAAFQYLSKLKASMVGREGEFSHFASLRRSVMCDKSD